MINEKIEMVMGKANILFLVGVILLAVNMIEGYKKGMIKEIISYINLAIACVVMAITINAIFNYMDKKYLNLGLAFVILAVIGVVHHVLNVVIFSAKVISELPIVRWVDKVAGVLFGALLTVMLFWIMYFVCNVVDTSEVGTWIMRYTEQNPVLTWIYEHNLLVEFLKDKLSNFHFTFDFTLPSFELPVQINVK